MSFRGSKQRLIEKEELQKGNANKWPELKEYFYDADKREVLGRDTISWRELFAEIHADKYS